MSVSTLSRPIQIALAVSGRILQPRPYFVTLTLYLVAMWFLRLWLFPAGSADDAEQLFFAQSFELGYKAGQPPLYTWIVWSAEQVFGVSLGLVVAIKYGFIWLTHLLAFILGRQLTNSSRWGVLTSLCLFAIYYLAWDSILNYSQTVLIAALAFAGVAAVRAIVRNGSASAAVTLGLIVGVGIMTKYNFALFSVALIGAALLDRRGRGTLIGRGGVFGLIAAALISLPHLVWLITGHVSGAALTQAVPAMSATDGSAFAWGPFLAARGVGLLDTLEATVSILLPFLVIWLIFFPRSARRIGSAAGETVTADLRLMERIFGLFLLQVLLLVAVAGMTEVRNHWFIVLVPFVAYAVLRTAAVYGDPADPRPLACSAVLLMLACAVTVGIATAAILEKQTCFECDMVIPYDKVAENLKSRGFSRGNVFASDQPSQIAGNLRPYFPGAQLNSLVFSAYQPPEPKKSTGCLAIWMAATDTVQSTVTNANSLRQWLGLSDEESRLRNGQFDIEIANGRRQTYGYILIGESDLVGVCK